MKTPVPETERKPARKAAGRVFQRKGSSFWWIGYYLNGREYRESARTSDPQQAEKFLRHRLRQVGADQIGAQQFISPQQEKVRVSELLDALQDDYQLRHKDSPQFRSTVNHVRKVFGDWRALALTTKKVDEYIKEQLEANWKPATINRRTQLLKQAYKLAIENEQLSKAPKIRHLSEEGNTRQENMGRAKDQNGPGQIAAGGGIGESWELYDFPPGVVDESADWISSEVAEGRLAGKTLHELVRRIRPRFVRRRAARGPTGAVSHPD